MAREEIIVLEEGMDVEEVASQGRCCAAAVAPVR